MALDTVLKAALRNWWLIALTTLLTVVSTTVFTLRQVPIYGAATTIEIRPNATLDQASQVTNAMQAIQNKVVVNTLARKATTSIVEAQVAARLQIPVKALDASNLSAVVLPDTGLIEVHAQSTSPVLAAAIANTTAQVLSNELMVAILQADIIDLAVPPTTPVGASTTRSIALGFVFGLIMGIVLALVEYIIFTFREAHGMPTPRLRHLAGVYRQRLTGTRAPISLTDYDPSSAALPSDTASAVSQEYTSPATHTHDATVAQHEAAVATLEPLAVAGTSVDKPRRAESARRNGNKPHG